MSSFPSSLDFTRAAAPFLKALPAYLRDVPGEPGLKHYGSGESGHWAVQINQQVAGALACLASLPPETLSEAGCALSAAELRDMALAMTRYSLRTHRTGDLDCTDGKKWGRHWISVLGYERMIPGLDLLREFFTADDEARLRALVECECDYRMNEYELVADPDASTGRNKPESNIWNGAFLLRAAAMMREWGAERSPSRQDEGCDVGAVPPKSHAWRALESAPANLDQPALTLGGGAAPRQLLERGTDFLVNGLSFQDDAENATAVLGKPVRERFVGANFFSDGALDHHGYLNVGYAYVCLSNLALLYFSFKRRGLPPPAGFMHNLRRVWEWCKRCTFPDGRLLRIGGDSRARYTYCQAFALQGWHLAWDLWRDEDAARFARGYLALVAHEQAENPDGTFYGKRLAAMRAESPWWETRLECDPFTVLATSAHWAAGECECGAARSPSQAGRAPENALVGTASADSSVLPVKASGETAALADPPLWIGAYHGAALLRTPGAVRSVVARAFCGPTRSNARNFHETGPAALCLPENRSDMAEWSGNLFAFIGLRGPKHVGSATVEETPGGFRWRWEGDILEDNPLGEGEDRYHVLRRRCSAEALPDGRTMRISDRVECIKETTLPVGFRALNLQIPNDIYNGHRRVYTAGDQSAPICETRSYPPAGQVVETNSTSLKIDGALRVRSLSGKRLRILRPAGQGAYCYNGLTSQYVETVVTDCSLESTHLMPGDVLVDESYEVEVVN